MGRSIGFVAYLLLVFAAPLPGAPSDPFNVDFRIGWDGCYRPDRWNPIEVGIATNRKGVVGGTAVIEGRQDELHRLAVAHPFVVTDQAPTHFTLATRLCPAAERFNLSLIDEKGKTFWRNDYEMWNFSQEAGSAPINSSQLFIGLSGKRGFSLLALPQHSFADHDGNQRNSQPCLKEKLPSALPWDWTGYDCLDVLILYDLDWASLRAPQTQAICDWVSRGGRLMMILGSHPLPEGSPLRSLLPVKIGSLRSREVPASWSGDAPNRRDWTVNAWDLEIADPACCTPFDPSPPGESASAQNPLAVEGLSGFGQVMMLSFDPSEMEGVSAEDASARWCQWLSDLAQPFRLKPGAPSESHAYSNNRPPESPMNVQRYLQDIPQLRPLNVGWILLLLLGLAVLLGPVDYFLLKKLDRLPLTWLTSLAIIGLFTAGAYFGARALRSGDLQLRFVSTLLAVQDGPAWQNTYYGIYAPSSSQYEFGELGKGQWWAPFNASENPYYYHASGLTSRTITCQQRDGMNVPLPLPINIWSMQCMQEESPLEAVPLRALWQGNALTITNTSSSTLSGVKVFTQRGTSSSQAIAPGQSKQLTLPQGALKSYDPFFSMAFAANHPWVLRSGALERYLKAGACVVSAEVDNPAPPHGLVNRSAHATGTQSICVVVLAKPER